MWRKIVQQSIICLKFNFVLYQKKKNSFTVLYNDTVYDCRVVRSDRIPQIRNQYLSILGGSERIFQMFWNKLPPRVRCVRSIVVHLRTSSASYCWTTLSPRTYPRLTKTTWSFEIENSWLSVRADRIIKVSVKRFPIVKCAGWQLELEGRERSVIFF